MRRSLIGLPCISLIVILSLSQLTLSKLSTKQEPPTVYEYFGGDGQLTGLVAENKKFSLNGKELRIVSGSIHFFRVHSAQWRDRLKKLRALGANAVETYVPWNLHEPYTDEFDFGDGDNDFSALLDVRRFVQIAQEEDLLVLLRPGPYICAEWEFGGFPSWLQRDPGMRIRTSYQPYLDRIKIYFDKLLPLLADLQFTRGGPIIAIQLENEYSSFRPADSVYMQFIKDSFTDNGFAESLYFTSDNRGVEDGSLPEILKTANFQSEPDMHRIYGELEQIQPDMPFMAMEFWTGWFDNWFAPHSIRTPTQIGNVLEGIFGTYNGSVNFYMFCGGTSFGFLAGGGTGGDGSWYLDITSYDYDSPLSESGDYTPKYLLLRDIIETHQIPQLHRPPMPESSPKIAYPTVTLQNYLTFDDILDQVPSSAKFRYEKPAAMEDLPMNGDNGPFSGQSYGYILYRKNISISNGSVFTANPIHDYGIVMVDGKIQPTDGYWIHSEQDISLQVDLIGEHTVDLLIENTGRGNWFGNEAQFWNRRGLPDGYMKINDQEISDIQVVALEFKGKWVTGLENWKPIGSETPQAPVVIQSTFEIEGEPADTFLDMTLWHKGIVFINGFNLGRYFRVGPQQTLYVPAPILKTGTNTITIFEQLQPGSELIFTDAPILAINQ